MNSILQDIFGTPNMSDLDDDLEEGECIADSPAIPKVEFYKYQKNMTCPVQLCGKKIYSTKYTYNRHWKNTHRNICEHYPCKICKYQPKELCDLRNHMMCVHNVEPNEEERMGVLRPNKEYIDPKNHIYKEQNIGDHTSKPTVTRITNKRDRKQHNEYNSNERPAKRKVQRCLEPELRMPTTPMKEDKRIISMVRHKPLTTPEPIISKPEAIDPAKQRCVVCHEGAKYKVLVPKRPNEFEDLYKHIYKCNSLKSALEVETTASLEVMQRLFSPPIDSTENQQKKMTIGKYHFNYNTKEELQNILEATKNIIA